MIKQKAINNKRKTKNNLTQVKEKILNTNITFFKHTFSTKKIFLHPLFSGSMIMIIGSNFANFIAYIYHLIVGRILGPSAYGELTATIATLGLFSTAFTFLGLVIVKFVSSADDKEKPNLYSWFSKRFLIIGILLFMIFIPLSTTLSKFLHLDIKITYLIAPILFVSLLNVLYKSFLQGLMRFGVVVLLSNLELTSRLVIGLILIFFGLSTFGGVLGIFGGGVLSTMLAAYYLRDFRKKNEKEVFNGSGKVIRYALPVLVISLANISLISTDVILAKHFLNAGDAGIYASLSTLGKIIFYGTSPISSVMFPIVSRRHAKGMSNKKILYLSLTLTIIVAFGLLSLYVLIPKVMINILYGSKFIGGTSYLIWFGVFLTLYTFANLIISFYLSLNRLKITLLPVTFAILQILGITIFHKNIIEIVSVSIAATTLLLISLLIYFTYERRKAV